LVAFPGSLAQRGAGTAALAAQVQDRSISTMEHPGQRRGAGEHLGGGDADRLAVLDVAPARISWITRRGGHRAGAGRFRGNARRGGTRLGTRRGGDDVAADVDHDLVHRRVLGFGRLPGQERLRHRRQRIG
jgi:hypothetical protein